jgi:hypothetical protein
MSDDETMDEPIGQPAAVYVAAALVIALFLMFACAMSSMYRAF